MTTNKSEKENSNRHTKQPSLTSERHEKVERVRGVVARIPDERN